MENRLLFGDNYDGLLYLAQEENLTGKVRLVYIDPPYGTNQKFTVSNDRVSTISRSNAGRLAYSDMLTGDDYLEFLRERLVLIRDLMAEDGSIYFHIDNKMGHYVKVLMDKVFGQRNFINDIARIKCNPKNFPRNGFGNMKDTILLYSKSKKNLWNNPRQPIDETTVEAKFRLVDSEGRRYTTTPLHAPGETANGATGREWKGMLPPSGRHWRYNPKVLDELDKQGLIVWSANGNPRKKIYAEDVKNAGLKMQDVWMYKDPQNPKYPTEKNMAMLKMIVGASSNKGDIVLDAFCGSGSTLVAAQNLHRNWIGIDSSKEAISICKKLLSHFTLTEISETKTRNERMGKAHPLFS
jgi:adenine-specific DNA-methyltransferase